MPRVRRRMSVEEEALLTRLEPRSTEEAFCFQFSDDIRVMRAMAYKSRDAFNKALGVLEQHIAAYKTVTKRNIKKIKA